MLHDSRIGFDGEEKGPYRDVAGPRSRECKCRSSISLGKMPLIAIKPTSDHIRMCPRSRERRVLTLAVPHLRAR